MSDGPPDARRGIPEDTRDVRAGSDSPAPPAFEEIRAARPARSPGDGSDLVRRAMYERRVRSATLALRAKRVRGETLDLAKLFRDAPDEASAEAILRLMEKRGG